MRMTVTNCIFSALAACLLCGPITSAANENLPRAQVMLFGVFHFANPGLDVVKVEQMNVMTAENQAYLAGLAARIASFNPTVILLEFNPSKTQDMQSRYEQYLDGKYELGSNEIYQLGFRIGKHSGVENIYSFDEQEVGWQAEPLFEFMAQHDQAAKARMDKMIAEVTREHEEAHASKTLAELLAQSNDPEQDALNQFFYLVTNPVGAGENFVGADAAASWWHRNFRMYSLIQKHAQPGERVLAIGGQGHTAILKSLLELDTDREAVDVRPYLIHK